MIKTEQRTMRALAAPLGTGLGVLVLAAVPTLAHGVQDKGRRLRCRQQRLGETSVLRTMRRAEGIVRAKAPDVLGGHRQDGGDGRGPATEEG